MALAPAWAEVSIDSQPSGADILVDGETTGNTPAAVEILQGERQLIVQLPGYADWQQTLELVAGQPQDLGLIQLQPAAGILELSSVPSGANVTLDGEFQGQTPLTLEISPDASTAWRYSNPATAATTAAWNCPPPAATPRHQAAGATG